MLRKLVLCTLLLTVWLNLAGCSIPKESKDMMQDTIEENNIMGKYIEGVLPHKEDGSDNKNE